MEHICFYLLTSLHFLSVCMWILWYVWHVKFGLASPSLFRIKVQTKLYGVYGHIHVIIDMTGSVYERCLPQKNCFIYCLSPCGTCLSLNSKTLPNCVEYWERESYHSDQDYHDNLQKNWLLNKILHCFKPNILKGFLWPHRLLTTYFWMEIWNFSNF